MDPRSSKYDIAIEQLDKIASQLQRGLINKKDHDGQRLLILIELGIAVINEFHNKEDEKWDIK